MKKKANLLQTLILQTYALFRRRKKCLFCIYAHTTTTCVYANEQIEKVKETTSARARHL